MYTLLLDGASRGLDAVTKHYIRERERDRVSVCVQEYDFVSLYHCYNIIIAALTLNKKKQAP